MSINVDEDCIQEWLEDPDTIKRYGDYFIKYRNWFKKKGYWTSAQTALQEYENMNNFEDRYNHVNILKEYIRSEGKGSRDRRNMWNSVHSFYTYHRLPLTNVFSSDCGDMI